MHNSTPAPSPETRFDEDELRAMHAAVFGRHEWQDHEVVTLVRFVGGRPRAFKFAPAGDVDEVVAAVRRLEQSHPQGNTHLGVAVYDRRKIQQGKRGGADAVTAMPALVLDIDTADGAHRGEHLPSRNDAHRLIREADFRCGLLVNSGGGFHAYYLLDEPLRGSFVNGSANKALLTRWSAYWERAGQTFDCSVDVAVSADPARLLRPAGTHNRKEPTAPRAVTIDYSAADQLVRGADLDEKLPQIAPAPTRKPRPGTAPARSRSHGPAPFALDRAPGALEALLEAVGAAPGQHAPDRWIWPRDDGSYSDDDTHGEILRDSDTPVLSVFGERWRNAWRLAGPSDVVSANRLLVQFICAGDSDLAQRIVERHTMDEVIDVEGLSVRVDAALESTDVRATLLASYPANTVFVPHPEVVAVAAHFEQTESGMADRIATYWRGHLHYETAHDEWRRWNGKVWARATPPEMIQLVNQTRTFMRNELAHRAAVDPTSGQVQLDKQHEAWLEKQGQRSALNNALDLLKSVEGVEVASDVWDRDDLLLNCQDGLVDLRTGECGPHDPAALCTRIAAGSGRADIEPTPDLKLLLDGYRRSDEELPDFLQTTFGIAATGRSPRFFCHIYGAPGTGKSTLAKACAAALGGLAEGLATHQSGYAATIRASALTDDRGGHQEGLTPLRGARLLISDEASNIAIKGDLVKQIASGDYVSFSGKNRPEVRMRPRATLIFLGNAALRLPADDEGLAERFYPVHVRQPLEGRRDADLARRLIEQQENLDAVLAWMIRGATRWLAKDAAGAADRIDAPAYVLRARAQYLASENLLSEWAAERLELLAAPQSYAERQKGTLGDYPTVGECRHDYATWCDSERVQLRAKDREFPGLLVALGYVVSDDTSANRGGQKVKGRFVTNGRLLEPAWLIRGPY